MRRVIPLLLCLLLTACHSRKMAMNGGTAEGPSVVNTAEASLARIVDNVNAKRQTEEYVTSKLSLKLSAGGKEASVGGSLRMKRNDVLQISLVALGIMEVGRLEMTPTSLLVMDRIGHQYVQVDYDDVPFLKEAGSSNRHSA